MNSMVMFGIFQLINVVLGTLRSICTIKANKHVGMILNVISFTFYAAVVKMTGTQEMWYVLTTTAITNCFGFYFANWIFHKSQKDKLWRISITVLNTQKGKEYICNRLSSYNIEYSVVTTTNGCIIDVFSYTQAESSLIKEIVNKLPRIKYSVIEIDKKL